MEKNWIPMYDLKLQKFDEDICILDYKALTFGIIGLITGKETSLHEDRKPPAPTNACNLFLFIPLLVLWWLEQLKQLWHAL